MRIYVYICLCYDCVNACAVFICVFLYPFLCVSAFVMYVCWRVIAWTATVDFKNVNANSESTKFDRSRPSSIGARMLSILMRFSCPATRTTRANLLLVVPQKSNKNIFVGREAPVTDIVAPSDRVTLQSNLLSVWAGVSCGLR